MKKISYFIFLILCLAIIPVVMAAKNPYSKYKNWYGEKVANCTYDAWQAAYDNLGIALPGWGNANTWLSSAAKAGYSIGSKPKKNSIVVFDDGGYGHVAFVTAFNEEEETFTLAGEGTMSLFEYEINGYYTLGYIYLDEAPKKSSSSNSSSSSGSSSSSSNKTTSSASSALKSLEVENYKLDFKKDTYTYVLEVPNEVTKIKVNAKAQDSKAKVENTGEKELRVGDNYIAIKVTSTDKAVSSYNLIVTRLAEDVKSEEEVTDEETSEEELENTSETVDQKDDKKNKNLNKLLIVGIISPIVLIIIILCVVLLKAQRKDKNGKEGKEKNRKNENKKRK